MKNLILLLITLTTFMNVSYASFPVEDEFNVSNFIEFTEIADNSICIDTLKNKPLIYGILAGSTIDESPFWKYLWIIPVVLLGLLILGMSAMKMN
jgi:hypothetical protein